MQNDSNFSLDYAIGQMVMVGFRGTAIHEDSQIVDDIQNRHLSGVILFDRDLTSNGARNIQSPEQVKALTESLKRFASSSPLPLLLAIDEEGGQISRLKSEYGFGETVSNRRLGEVNSEEYTRRERRKIAKTLSELGINFNLSPVVDLDINPDNPAIGRKARSFSATPEIVIQHAAWTIQEFHRYQILTSLKHFPGQGSAQDDSHLGFTDVTSTYTRAELAPFRRLIEMDLADSVMVAHIFHGDWDSTYPASLSKRIITGILRKQLTYDGVVISDCLQMGAISNYYNLEETIRLAIDAGNDILLFSNNLAYESTITERAISIIKQLIEKNVISEQRIFESLERIKSMKNRVNTLDYS